jgi:hypothetical protein
LEAEITYLLTERYVFDAKPFMPGNTESAAWTHEESLSGFRRDTVGAFLFTELTKLVNGIHEISSVISSEALL